MRPFVTRREFLGSAGSLWALMHAPALFGGPGDLTVAPARIADATLGSPEPEPALELLHLRLLAAHFDEQVAFYRDTLRLPILKQSAGSASFQVGSTELEFVPAPRGVEPMYHFAFNIPENKLDSAREWTLRRVPLIVQKSTGSDVLYFAHWNAHAIYFHDADKNLVEFIARHTLSNARPGAFDERDILLASEIGVVTQNVPETVGQLKSQLDIAEYKGYSDDFTAVGNEHGLFIVVNSRRPWLLTNQPALPYASGVRLRVRARRDRSFHLPGPVEIHSTR